MGNDAERIAEIENALVDGWRTQLAETADIKWLIADLRAALAALKDALNNHAEAQAALAAARAALKKYGRHQRPCRKDYAFADVPCTCDFDKVLSTPGDAPNDLTPRN